MSAETVYRALIDAGLTTAGACGLMGNMQAESGMRANIAQRGMTSLSDEAYTAAADSGQIDFAHDSVGYGLCQWTFYSRKAALLAYARAKGKSVGDEAMQAAFCLKELREDFPALWQFLCGTQDVYAAAERICKEYERPAVNNVETRAALAKGFYDLLADSCTSAEGVAAPAQDGLKDELTNETVMHLQAILVAYGYELGTSRCSSGVDGLIGKKTVTALKDFTERLEAIV